MHSAGFIALGPSTFDMIGPIGFRPPLPAGRCALTGNEQFVAVRSARTLIADGATQSKSMPPPDRSDAGQQTENCREEPATGGRTYRNSSCNEACLPAIEPPQSLGQLIETALLRAGDRGSVIVPEQFFHGRFRIAGGFRQSQ